MSSAMARSIANRRSYDGKDGKDLLSMLDHVEQKEAHHAPAAPTGGFELPSVASTSNGRLRLSFGAPGEPPPRPQPRAPASSPQNTSDPRDDVDAMETDAPLPPAGASAGAPKKKKAPAKRAGSAAKARPGSAAPKERPGSAAGKPKKKGTAKKK
mmetsp:Transcript_29328/g.78742  ORF Transcript_29328/g.78742 Transcript_29328/m.78742 type:complete len:155 (+) Transcript_29328:53-517(+)